jgi:hypothetical protein
LVSTTEGIGGVKSLNSATGNVTIVGDTSIGITTSGTQITASTAGRAQNVGTIACTSINTTGNITAGGTIYATEFENYSPLNDFSFSLPAGATFNGGNNGPFFTVTRTNISHLQKFRVLVMQVVEFSLATGQGGGMTYWFAITANHTQSSLLGQQNRITAQAIHYYNTNVNAGTDIHKYSLILPYTYASWPNFGVQLYVTASAGGWISFSGRIYGLI